MDLTQSNHVIIVVTDFILATWFVVIVGHSSLGVEHNSQAMGPNLLLVVLFGLLH